MLTFRTFVDPCPYIQRVYAEHHAALAAVTPPPAGADEAGVRAWAAPNVEKVSNVLGSQRAWQLVCVGDLLPDPWDEIVRVQKLHRDALHQLLKEGKLSREGIAELMGAERALQLVGAGDDSGPSLADIEAAAPSGTMEVSVHSPVSLHAWSEDGGHVGWNGSANASESTIAGATYEGAPGGGQTIVLPAGFYKITVDELESGQYLLEVRTNGTGADTEDVHLVKSSLGRTTSTHFAVTEGWDGPRLDTFPVRRGATTSSVAFVDEGAPSVRAGPGATARGVQTGDSQPAGDEGRVVPGTALALVAAALVLVALGRRR